MSRILSSTSILPSSNPYKWIHPKLSHTTTLHIIILLNPNFLGHPSSRACVAVVVPACLHSFMDMSIENPRNRKRTSTPTSANLHIEQNFSKILSLSIPLRGETLNSPLYKPRRLLGPDDGATLPIPAPLAAPCTPNYLHCAQQPLGIFCWAAASRIPEH